MDPSPARFVVFVSDLTGVRLPSNAGGPLRTGEASPEIARRRHYPTGIREQLLLHVTGWGPAASLSVPALAADHRLEVLHACGGADHAARGRVEVGAEPVGA